MKKGWIALAAGLLVAGLVLFAAGMTALGWDFSKLGTGKLVTNTHGVSQGFEDIILVTDTADVTFLPAADGKCTVVCREWEKEQHKVFVEDGSLTIRLEDKRAWYEHIGIRFGSPGITVYLPEGQYGTLNIKTDTGRVEMPADFVFENATVSLDTGHIRWDGAVLQEASFRTDTGDVRLQGIWPERLTVKVSTGNTILQDIACGSLAALGDTGDISLENVTARELLQVVRDTGDVRLTRCDGGEISIKTDTGDVIGSLLSEKVFSVHSDTGRVNVPKSVAGGPCEITTDTGDIKITIAD